MTVPIAALTAALIGVPQAVDHLSLEVVAAAAGLALLFPVLQYALDMLALRHMTQTAFGTLMALEPAVGVLLGLLLLSQVPSPVQVTGIALVVFAGAGAQRGGRRCPTARRLGRPTSRPSTHSPYWSRGDPPRPFRGSRRPASPQKQPLCGLLHAVFNAELCRGLLVRIAL